MGFPLGIMGALTPIKTSSMSYFKHFLSTRFRIDPNKLPPELLEELYDTAYIIAGPGIRPQSKSETLFKIKPILETFSAAIASCLIGQLEENYDPSLINTIKKHLGIPMGILEKKHPMPHNKNAASRADSTVQLMRNLWDKCPQQGYTFCEMTEIAMLYLSGKALESSQNRKVDVKEFQTTLEKMAKSLPECASALMNIRNCISDEGVFLEDDFSSPTLEKFETIADDLWDYLPNDW